MYHMVSVVVKRDWALFPCQYPFIKNDVVKYFMAICETFLVVCGFWWWGGGGIGGIELLWYVSLPANLQR